MAIDGTSSGGMFFDVGANLDPLRKDLEQMKAEAAKAGEEAGKAFTQGVSSQGGLVAGPGIGGNIGGVGGSLSGGGVGGVGGGLAGPGVNAAAAAAGAPPGAVPVVIVGGNGGSGGGGGGLAPPGSGGVFDAAAIGLAINQMAQVFEKFEKMGEVLGNILSENIRQMHELELATRLNAELAGRQQSTQDRIESASVSGNKMADLTTLQAQRRALEDQNRAIESKGASAGLNYLDILLDPQGFGMALGADLAAGGGFSGAGSGYMGPIQRQSQATKLENEKQIIAISDQIKGIQSGAQSTGSIAGSVTGETGVGRGTPLTPAEAAGYESMLRENPDLAKESARWLKMSYQQQQDEIINRTVSRHTPIR